MIFNLFPAETAYLAAKKDMLPLCLVLLSLAVPVFRPAPASSFIIDETFRPVPEKGVPSGRPLASAAEEEPLRVLFWNLENFFDWHDGGSGEADREFSAAGSRHWTRRRFMAKAAAVAKTLLWTADHGGALPDIFAMAEVENAFVLRMLLRETALRKTDYEMVHFDSPDRRGIDVALLYRRSRFRLLNARPVRIEAVRNGDTLRTRDILLVQLESGDGNLWTILVNHHPSKFGGGPTDWRREAAVERLRALSDSLSRAGETGIIATGDFNDTPDAPVFRRLTAFFPETKNTSIPSVHGSSNEGALLINLAEPLARRGLGTIRYEGRWELIDMFFVPAPLAPRCTMEILAPPFLTVHDNVHSGDRPFRTWLGPRYIGGVSDHRPVLLTVIPDDSLD